VIDGARVSASAREKITKMGGKILEDKKPPAEGK